MWGLQLMTPGLFWHSKLGVSTNSPSRSSGCLVWVRGPCHHMPVHRRGTASASVSCLILVSPAASTPGVHTPHRLPLQGALLINAGSPGHRDQPFSFASESHCQSPGWPSLCLDGSSSLLPGAWSWRSPSLSSLRSGQHPGSLLLSFLLYKRWRQ